MTMMDRIKDSLLALALGMVVASKLQAWLPPPPQAALEPPSAERVDDLLAHRMVVHVGGQHRGGTTILWKALTAAGVADLESVTPEAKVVQKGSITTFDDDLTCRAQSRFGCKGAIFGCSCMESEGLFVQSVMPTWRLEGATEDGIGRFALQNGTRLSEGDVKPGDRERLFADWAPLWGILPFEAPTEGSVDEAPNVKGAAVGSLSTSSTATDSVQSVSEVLLEKTPSTTRTVRFLDALWLNQATTMSPNHYRHFPKFIFITRHPLATSLALESFSTTRPVAAVSS